MNEGGGRKEKDKKTTKGEKSRDIHPGWIRVSNAPSLQTGHQPEPVPH